MSENPEAVSAATSCLLYVHQYRDKRGTGLSVTNALILDWLDSAERRGLCSRPALKCLRNALKKAKKNQVKDLMSILELLIEGDGAIPEIPNSPLARVQNLRDALTRRGWWVKFGTQTDWERLDLLSRTVCFGLLTDVERCFDFRGQQIEPLSLYFTGECQDFAKEAHLCGFHCQAGQPESVDNILVWRCDIYSGEVYDDRKTDRAA